MVPQLEVEVARPTEEEFAARLAGCRGAMHFRTRITAAMLARCPELRFIVFLGTGLGSWIDLAAAEARGIRIRRVLGYADRAVAEHALALIFAAARNLAWMDRALRGGAWSAPAGIELAGKRLGLIGLGGIGRALASMASAIGLEVVGWNRRPVPPEIPCRMLPLDEVLASAEIVSLHLALDDETRGIVDRRRLALLRPGAILVNTARGGLMDETALVERLARGDIAAALDVFAEEPLPAASSLRRLDNVTLTAHAAWATPEATRRLLRLGLAAMRDEIAIFAGRGGS